MTVPMDDRPLPGSQSGNRCASRFSMNTSRWHYLRVEEVVGETPKAFLLQLESKLEAIWMPKSQMAHPEDCEVGDYDVDIAVTEWIAMEKGLI
jgi:hypothetical protein